MTTILALQAAGGQGMALMIQFALIIGIMFFLFILPQRRERKRHTEMLAALKPGDQIATTGGLVGDVITIREDLVTIKSGDARVVVERLRIARRITPPPAA